MQTQERIHVITAEGEIQRWDMQKTTLQITDQLLESVSANVVRKANMVLPAPGPAYGPINLAIGTDCLWWTVPVGAIQLKAPFKVLPGGTLTPDFAGRDNVLTMSWPVPSAFRVVLLISTNSYKVSDHYSDKSYLVALDKDGRTFRMPLANLHNTCQLCLGQYDNNAGTHLDCIVKAIKQFESSQWNKDLNDRHAPEAIQGFFRFKPNKDGFDALLPDGDWTSLCQKVVIADLSNIVTV